MVSNPRQNITQNGSALAVTMFMLTILTLLVIAGTSRTITLEKMANNSFNHLKSLQSAEATLRGAEIWINSLISQPIATDTCAQTPCDIIWQADILGTNFGGSLYTQNWWTIRNSVTSHNWWQQNGRDVSSVSASSSINYISDAPRFFIEEIAFIPDDLGVSTQTNKIGTTYYRITSRSVGSEASQSGNAQSQVQIQSIFSKRFN